MNSGRGEGYPRSPEPKGRGGEESEATRRSCRHLFAPNISAKRRGRRLFAGLLNCAIAHLAPFAVDSVAIEFCCPRP